MLVAAFVFLTMSGASGAGSITIKTDSAISGDLAREVKELLSWVGEEKLKADFFSFFKKIGSDQPGENVVITVSSGTKLRTLINGGDAIGLHLDATANQPQVNYYSARDLVIFHAAKLGESKVLADTGFYIGECGADSFDLKPIAAITQKNKTFLVVSKSKNRSGCCGQSDQNEEKLAFFEAPSLRSAGEVLTQRIDEDNDSCSGSNGKKAKRDVTKVDFGSCKPGAECSPAWSRTQSISAATRKHPRLSSGTLVFDGRKFSLVPASAKNKTR